MSDRSSESAAVAAVLDAHRPRVRLSHDHPLPVLRAADGIVAGDAVVCPLHAWRVDLTSGSVDRPSNTSMCVSSYAVRVDEGVLMLQLPTEEARKADQAA